MAQMESIISAAKEELRELYDTADYPEDLVFEIADSHVPVYHHQLCQLAAEDFDLMLTEPELGPAFDGTPTPINIIAANVYERISAALHEELYDLQLKEAA